MISYYDLVNFIFMKNYVIWNCIVSHAVVINSVIIPCQHGQLRTLTTSRGNAKPDRHGLDPDRHG